VFDLHANLNAIIWRNVPGIRQQVIPPAKFQPRDFKSLGSNEQYRASSQLSGDANLSWVMIIMLRPVLIYSKFQPRDFKSPGSNEQHRARSQPTGMQISREWWSSYSDRFWSIPNFNLGISNPSWAM